MNLSNFISSASPSDIEIEQGILGVGIHTSVLSFNEAFIQDGKCFLDDFIAENSNVKKWMLSSDYAFYGQNKKNDVVTFSLFPHLVNFKRMVECIELMAPTDIKHARTVSDEFISFLKEGPVFNISIILERGRRMYSDEVGYFSYRLESMILYFKNLCELYPENKEYYESRLLKIKQAKNTLNNKSTNLKLFRDIEIVASLAAYILAEVRFTANPEIITWLSDRDSMLTYRNKSIGDFMFECVNDIYNMFCLSNMVEPYGRTAFVKPEVEGELFYDSLVRVPDYIAGALSDFDFETQKTTHAKFEKIRNGTFHEEKRNLSYELFFHPKFEAQRIKWGPELE
ncbi:hypothetical protein [Klebsiella michiganensis]|uniref:hypothetical protein n=3 Tax=Klebsiella michiganensis TaxID=1134687 RepID=UPI001008EA48|nr:hypothetical protein [Klebsiella michiganensis]MBE0132408.1 hypothetical protein [Klebsiella michiganensis]MBE0201976.1 hypothetical protein [Klebsiella michiganensis]MDV0364025.1 hypothetical protein [Klebsiella michiganensis]MEC5785733.1 hypothetical protein [Klebsiella michiganensis]RXI16509.1 hypothetical protein DOD04_22430 [Klebsiella michiganensis]